MLRAPLLRAADPERGGKFMMTLRNRKKASPDSGLVKKSAKFLSVLMKGTTKRCISTSSRRGR